MGALGAWTYLNGVYAARESARISPFDRGFLFADAVYEVTAVYDGRLVDLDGHMMRLERSLGELDIDPCPDLTAISDMHAELVARNSVDEGLVYLQVSRGAFSGRDFIAPERARPTLFAFTDAKPIVDVPHARAGLKILTTPDLRWLRRDIKTTGLLAQALAKTEAARAGLNDAWMVEGEEITEGASANAWIVAADGTLITRHLSNRILAGITRAAVLDVAPKDAFEIEERVFTLEEAYAAREAFQTSASSLVGPVVEINGRPIGDGAPGPVTRRFQALYFEKIGADPTLVDQWNAARP